MSGGVFTAWGYFLNIVWEGASFCVRHEYLYASMSDRSTQYTTESAMRESCEISLWLYANIDTIAWLVCALDGTGLFLGDDSRFL